MNTYTENNIDSIIAESLSRAFSYTDFRNMVDQLAATGKTTGPDQTDSLINYTLLNSRRLKRWDKTVKIPNELIEKIKTWDRPISWLVLTESWCGDAAPTMPVMNKVAELNSNIDLKVVLRDENPDLMKLFLTDNAMSIPKLIMFDAATFEVLGNWGPRPSKATKMAADYKMEHGILNPEFKEDLQHWYNTDKGLTTLSDLMQLLTLK